jgi:glycosyltransferase involved in cell wall biosynthesis
MTTVGLRIMYFVDSLGLGGANQTTLTVARRMKQAGHEVVFASDEGPLRDVLDECGIPHVRIRTKVRHPSPAAITALVKAVGKYSIELLCPNGFDCTLDAVPAGVLTGCPVFPTYGGIVSPPYPHPWLPRVNVFSEELSADLISDHGWHPRTFSNLIARVDGARFHPAVDGAPFRQQLGVGEDESLALMVCRQDAMKLQGILTLLDAAPVVRAANPRIRFALLGDGDRRGEVLSRIEEIHRRAGEEFIVAPGSSREIPQAFAAADIVVANGARSALEAMACRRPVVSVGPNGFCGVFSEETIKGFRRFNFDKGRLSGNPFGEGLHLVEAIARILGDEQLRETLAAFSLEYAERHLLIQHAAGRYEARYREVLGDPWAGRWGRVAVFRTWLATVARYYGHRLRMRSRPVRDTLQPPPPGLDPDWRIGLPQTGR